MSYDKVMSRENRVAHDMWAKMLRARLAHETKSTWIGESAIVNIGIQDVAVTG